jgi:hypothetical protein
MRITNLTSLGFYLTSALDSGKYANVTLAEVRQHIDHGTVFEFLARRLGNDIDLSMFDKGKRDALTDEWQRIDNAIDPRRKFGVERNGLALLLAFCLEGIQQRQDRNPSVHQDAA